MLLKSICNSLHSGWLSVFMLIQSHPCLNSIFSQICCTIQIRTVHKVFFMNPLHFLNFLCFEWYWAHMFFQAWLTSRSFDSYLTTIKNSSKQGKLLGRCRKEARKAHTLQTPITFSIEELTFPNTLKENHKSVSSTDSQHELRCFSSARQICFIQWVGLWAASV